MWASVVVATRLQSTGSVVVMHRLSCSVACETFPDQGLSPRLLLVSTGRFSTTEPPRKPAKQDVLNAVTQDHLLFPL